MQEFYSTFEVSRCLCLSKNLTWEIDKIDIVNTYTYIYIYTHLILYTSCISIVSYICGKIGSGRSELIWVPRILLHSDHDTKRDHPVWFSREHSLGITISYYHILPMTGWNVLSISGDEGRGIGLVEKIRAYELQDCSMSLLFFSTGVSAYDSLDRSGQIWTVCLVLFSNMIDYSLAHCYLINVRREVWTQCLGCSSDLPLLFLIPQCPILHWVSCLEERPFFD